MRSFTDLLIDSPISVAPYSLTRSNTTTIPAGGKCEGKVLYYPNSTNIYETYIYDNTKP